MRKTLLATAAFAPIAFALLAAPAGAAIVRTGGFSLDTERPTEILFEGAITEGSAADFAKLRASWPGAEVLRLAADSGPVAAAIALADAVRAAGMATLVRSDDYCYATCVLVFLAAEERLANGRIGLHTLPGGAAENAAAAAYLATIGADPGIAALMAATPAGDLHIVSLPEATEFGISAPGPRLAAVTVPGNAPPVSPVRPVDPNEAAFRALLAETAADPAARQALIDVIIVGSAGLDAPAVILDGLGAIVDAFLDDPALPDYLVTYFTSRRVPLPDTRDELGGPLGAAFGRLLMGPGLVRLPVDDQTFILTLLGDTIDWLQETRPEDCLIFAGTDPVAAERMGLLTFEYLAAAGPAVSDRFLDVVGQSVRAELDDLPPVAVLAEGREDAAEAAYLAAVQASVFSDAEVVAVMTAANGDFGAVEPEIVCRVFSLTFHAVDTMPPAERDEAVMWALSQTVAGR